MEEKRKNKTLSNQGESKARKTDNRQSKPARRRQVQSVSAKESVDMTEQIQLREALRQSLEQATRSQRMVLALSQAAQSISRARTIEGVYQAIQEQSSRLGYQTTGSELTADGKLRIVFTGYKPSLIRKAEKLTGFSQSDYLFSPRQGSVYQRVLFHSETVHLRDSAQAVAEALPSKMHTLARQIADIVGLAPTTFAPLIAGGETLGVLAFTGPNLTEADNPAITAFAGQAAIAMQNARLYEAAQKEIAERKQAEKSLRESEERYRDLVENIQDLVCTHDLQGNILFVNQAPAILLGYASNEWVGRNLRDLLSPKVRDQFDTYLSSIQRDGSASGFMRVLTRNGEERLWEYNNTLRTEGIDTPIVRGLARDVTERKRAEELLRESEERFRQMFDNMSSGAAIYEATKDGEDFILKDFNWAAERIEQVAKQDLIGKRVTQVFPGVVEFGLFEVFQRVWRTGVPEHHPISLYKDGRIAGWRENYIYKLPSGEIVAIYDDITERKRVEDALRESEERYRNIFNGVRDAIFVETLDGKILAANDRACEMYGYTRAEFLTKSVADLVPEGQSILMSTSKEIQSAPMETVNLRSNGERFPIEISGRVEIINGEELLLVIVRDITARKQVEDRLHQSEERYRLITNTVSDYVFSTMVEKDGSLKLNWVAGAFESITGYTFEEYVAHGGWRAMLHPDDREMDDRDLQTLHKNQKVISELRTLKKDGNVVWVRVYAHPVWDEQEQRLTGIHGAVQDITERKQADTALAKERSLLRALTDNIPDKIYFKDLESRFLLINHAQARAFGLSDPAQAIGKTDFDFFTEEHARPAYENEQAIIQSGQPLVGKEEKETWPDGRVGWALTTKMPLRDEKGNIIGTFGISKDITERKRAEAALRESEQRFRHLFVASPDALMLIDPSDPAVDWPIVDCNEIACQMNGYTREELIGKSVDILNITKGTPQERAAYLERIRRSGVLHLESFHRHRDGHIYPVEISTSIVTFEGHELVLGIDRDITERKQAEKTSEQRAHELQTLYQTSLEVNAQVDLDSLLRAIVQRAASLVGVDSGGLYLMQADGQSLKLVVGHNLLEHYTGMTLKLGEGLSGKVAQSGKAMVVNDYQRWKGRAKIFDNTTLRSMLGAPLRVKDKVIGVINVSDRTRSGSFSKEEIRLVSLFADQAALAIENARLFDDAQRRLRRTTALREIDQAIVGSMDIQHVLKIVLKRTISELGVDAAVILLFDPKEQNLHYELGSGFRADSLQFTRLRLGEGYAGRAALGKQTIYIPDLRVRNTDFLRSPTFHQEGFVCYFGVPLIAKGEIMGVLEVFHRASLNPDIEWLSFMETLAGQVAIAIDNATLYRNLQHSNVELSLAYDATIEGWSRALDLRDRETEGHTLRVTELTKRMAEEMGMSEEELVHIRRGALLHDIGKMGVPDRILLKPDTLTDEEWKIMHKHPIFAYEMLSPIGFLLPALDIPYCHHEKWDGAGYPRKLKGDEIPLVARIFAVVDVWDALTSNRPYRPAWTKDQALEYIWEQSGKHFDPNVVEVFLRLIAEE